MKKVNLTIIATIIATFVISMFAFQPTTTEASNGVMPNAMPTPRRIKPKTPTKGLDREIHTLESVKAKKPTNYQSGASAGGSRRKQPRTTMQYNPKELGIDKVSGTKIKARKPVNYKFSLNDVLVSSRRKHPGRGRRH